MNTTTPAKSPEDLRAAMVERVLAGRPRLSGRIAAAMRTVPRHLFVPHAALSDAYADTAVITKRAPDGAALSCASVPDIVAMMLDMLDLRPGHRVLEVGAGTGYNAALAAELVGPSGRVVTVDIDPDITAQARANLDSHGYRHVHVATRDGLLGDAEHAPYDRVIVTAGAWDIPSAWRAQLATGGRLVVPLRWRGQTRALGLRHIEDRLVSDVGDLCGFVPLIGQTGERTGTIDADNRASLHWDIDQGIRPDALCGVLDRPPAARWSDVTVRGQEHLDGIWVRLTTAEAGVCRLAVDQTAVDAGVADPIVPIRSPALVEGTSLAYLTCRPAPAGADHLELGAVGHGPKGADLAERFCLQLRAWGKSRGWYPTITVHPAGTPSTLLGNGFVIDKPETRLVLA